MQLCGILGATLLEMTQIGLIQQQRCGGLLPLVGISIGGNGSIDLLANPNGQIWKTGAAVEKSSRCPCTANHKRLTMPPPNVPYY